MRGNSLQRLDQDGWSVIHLDQIQTCEIVKNIMLETQPAASRRSNTLHIAIHNGSLEQIPVECLTDENLLVGDSMGNTALHLGAISSHLGDFPPGLLNAQNVLWRNSSGCTVLHAAASYGCWDGIPDEALTKENMMLLDNDGDTPLHLASGSSEHSEQQCLLSKVPRVALSWEALMAENKSGQTVLGLAAKRGNWTRS